MKSRFFILSLGAGVLFGATGTALSDTTAVTINYGTVESVQTVEQKGSMQAAHWPADYSAW